MAVLGTTTQSILTLSWTIPGTKKTDIGLVGKWRGGDIIAIDGLDPDAPVYSRDIKDPSKFKVWGRPVDYHGQDHLEKLLASGKYVFGVDSRERSDSKGKEVLLKKIEQLIFTLQTDERVPGDIGLDDGTRKWYVEEESSIYSSNHPDVELRGKPKKNTKNAALRDALVEAGVPLDPKVGGKLFVRLIGTEPTGAPSDRNLWENKYIIPPNTLQQSAQSSNGNGLAEQLAGADQLVALGASLAASQDDPFGGDEDPFGAEFDPRMEALAAVADAMDRPTLKSIWATYNKEENASWLPELKAAGAKRIKDNFVPADPFGD